MKKEDKKKEKKIYLPTSIIVAYSLILLILVFALVFIGPVAIDYLRHYLYDSFYSPDSIVILFFVILVLIVTIISLMFAMNERTRRRLDKYILEDDTNISTFSKLDSDRSYLEQQIAELSDRLLSSQKRWEDVNRLILSSHNYNVENMGEISPISFLANFNIDVNKYKVDEHLIFVLTPFHEDYISDYSIIKNTCFPHGYNTLRGDEEHIQGDILSHIVKCIAKSRIVIANLNGRNPNVFYELGIAHTLNKPTILISHIENDIPFDLRTQFVVIYKDDIELAKKLNEMVLQISHKTS